jgi:ubiquinone/menaquinone biosynthesis C-methylase UbiE
MGKVTQGKVRMSDLSSLPAKAETTPVATGLSPSSTDNGIPWSDYATQYDLMTEMIPVYQENIERLRKLIRERGLSGPVRVCDLGAGTGNYISGIADLLPEAQFTHVDFDPQMSAIAKAKYDAAGVQVNMVQDYMQRVDFEPGSFDLVLCINALYAAAPQAVVLQRIRRWLVPDGLFFCIDFGRRQKPLDWTWYIIKNAIRERRIRKLIGFVANSRHVIKSARRGSAYQEQGGYWMHSTEEFGQMMARAGFKVDTLDACYRGYADYAVCSVPEPSPTS